MKLNDITALITPNIARDILTNLGVEIKPRRNFSLRDDDKNPSVSMYVKNRKVKIHDFGVGFDGDLIDVLVEFFNFSYNEAKELIAFYLGLEKKKFHKFHTIKKEIKPYKEGTSHLQAT